MVRATSTDQWPICGGESYPSGFRLPSVSLEYAWRRADVDLPEEEDEGGSDDVLVLLSDDTMDVAYYDYAGNVWCDRYGFALSQPVHIGGFCRSVRSRIEKQTEEGTASCHSLRARLAKCRRIIDQGGG